MAILCILHFEARMLLKVGNRSKPSAGSEKRGKRLDAQREELGLFFIANLATSCFIRGHEQAEVRRSVPAACKRNLRGYPVK
ncbi:hypothetical protein NDU88_004647 [Pleurodeles waltl]|uniref:Uncharacterized protein n=1 Tax=Pleurodeles waltl TaxID=8319 RepID=A0AAV7NK95_PLEWA|nr:hypothetical protein NDU88_004647 [Pleurodeles waltl]